MRESQQAHLLTQYVESLKQNPDAKPPLELDRDMAEFARKLVDSQNHRRARVWSQVMAEVKHDSTAGGRTFPNTLFDETTTMTDPKVFSDYRAPHFPQTQKKRQTFPLTLAVASLVLILGLAVMIAVRSLPERFNNNSYGAQISDDQTKTPTMAASIVPTSTPIMMTNSAIEFSVQNAGELRNEAILIRNLGDTLNLNGWALSDGTGESYTFTQDTQLFNNGTVLLHSTSGTNTPVNYYWGLTSALFHDAGREISIFDADGNFVSSISADTTNLQATVMPTTTPPNLCDVSGNANGGTRVRNIPDQATSVQIGTLPEGTIAGVFEQVADSNGAIWYRIRADIDDAQISGWVLAQAVTEVGTSCPTIPRAPIAITATPIEAPQPTFVPTVPPDLTSLFSSYDYLPVVIASLDIPQGTQITENMLAVVYMPVQTVQDMVSRNGTVISGLGTFREGSRFAAEDIARWQPIFMTQLAEGGGGGGNGG